MNSISSFPIKIQMSWGRVPPELSQESTCKYANTRETRFKCCSGCLPNVVSLSLTLFLTSHLLSTTMDVTDKTHQPSSGLMSLAHHSRMLG